LFAFSGRHKIVAKVPEMPDKPTGKLLCIVGQLIAEISCVETGRTGNQSAVTSLAASPEGGCYRQAKYGKKAGYQIILVGRLGKDHFGTMILDSLNELGISTQYIEMSTEDYTGIEFEVRDAGGNLLNQYLDPGAAAISGSLTPALQRYVSLCDAVLTNQLTNGELSRSWMSFASDARIPGLFICEAARGGTVGGEADWILIDNRGGDEGEFPRSNTLIAHKGAFIFGQGSLSLRDRVGRECWRLPVPRETSLEETAIALLGLIRNDGLPDAELARCTLAAAGQEILTTKGGANGQ
jgi:hypothetical protein